MDARFRDNQDGTVTDLQSGLIWMKNDSFIDLNDFVIYSQAKKYLTKKNEEKFAGFDDWRLPSKEEAHSLFIADKSKSILDKYEMKLYMDPVFTEGGGFDTWTSNARGRITAYVYSYASGTGGHKEVDDTLNTSVRLVRGTMSEDFRKNLGKILPKKGMYVSDQR